MRRLLLVLCAVLPLFALDASASRCRGVCYGSISRVTGLARNSYVHSYVTHSGHVVGAYTRSHR